MAIANESNPEVNHDSDSDGDRLTYGEPPRYTLDSGEHDSGLVSVLNELLGGQVEQGLLVDKFASEIRRAAKTDEEGIKGALDGLWLLFIECAIEHPNSQSQLAAVIAQLAVVPEGEKPSESTDAPVFGRHLYWLNNEFLDEWQHVDIPNTAGLVREKCLLRWCNMNKFGAHLIQKQLPMMQLEKYALSTMRNGLEGSTFSYPDRRRLDDELPAAAAWIEVAGDFIFNRELNSPSSNEESTSDGGSLWDGKSGFSRERWDLWKRRFMEIAGQPGVTESTQISAREAANRMVQIEEAKS